MFDYSSFSEEDIKEYEALLLAEAQRNEEFRSYYEIIPILSDFYMEMMNFPFKQCVYERADGTFHSVALEVIKSRIKGDYPSGSRALLVNCLSESVRKWAEESDAGVFITEVGTFVNSQEYFIQPFETDPYDEVSSGPAISKVTQQFNPFINFGPGQRRRFFKSETENWLKGYDINPYVNDSKRIREARRARGLSVDCRPLKPNPELPECEPLVSPFFHK